MRESFSIDEVLSYGWKTTLKKFWFFLVLILIVSVIGGTLGGANNLLSGKTETWAMSASVLLSLVYLVAIIIMQVGIFQIALNVLDNKKVKYSQLFTNWDLFGNYLLGSIIYGLIVLGGTILLVFPGIMWGIRYQMYAYLIIDKKMGAWEALVESSRITKGHRWQLFGFYLPKIVVALIGILALGVGIFFAYPTIMMAETAIYRNLFDRAKK